MKRFAQDMPVMVRRAKIARHFGLPHTLAAIGRMRKKHPLDCGNPRCGVCSGHKRFGHEETRQEAVSRLKLTEAKQ